MRLLIEVEVEHIVGRFIDKETVAEAVADELRNVGSVDIDDSSYEIVTALYYGEDQKKIKVKA